jgi:hypothetical protein
MESAAHCWWYGWWEEEIIVYQEIYFDSMNRSIEAELLARIIHLLQPPQFLETPRFEAINRAQALIAMSIIDIGMQFSSATAFFEKLAEVLPMLHSGGIKGLVW